MNAEIPYAELTIALLPEIILTIGLLLVLGIDLLAGRRMSDRARRGVAVGTGLLALIAAAVFSILTTGHSYFGYAFILDTIGTSARVGVFALSALAMLLVTSTCAKQQRHPAEYIAIQLLATIGFSLMAVSNNLLIAFLGLELASLSLYVMAGFDKTSRASAEAGLKYFLFGGMAAAFMLFGFSLIYGLTGSIELPEIAIALSRGGMTPLLFIALVMVLVAFGYKAAAAPFHYWAPDVYQGAPAPAAALIASASKLAGFTLFARMLVATLDRGASGTIAIFGNTASWIPVVGLLALASMLLGNIAALAQTNVRRLIAYSAIAHAGNLLLGLIALNDLLDFGPLYYYVLTYGIATVGIFGVFAAIERTAPCQRISDLAGLWKRSPFLAGVLFICVLSLAGVPPLAGFFGKFYVFAAALNINGLASPAGWLTLLAIALSAVGLYYYLIILKAALVTNPPAVSSNSAAAATTTTGKIHTPVSTAVALVIVCALTIAMGLFPSVVLQIFK